MKNILLHGFNEFYFDAVSLLQNKYEWRPKVAIEATKNESLYKNQFPNLMFLKIEDLRTYKLNKYLSKIKIDPLDFDELSKLDSFREAYFSTFDDITGHNFSFEERRDIFMKFLTFWKSIISFHKVNLIIFFHWPHRNDCLSLYLLVKHVLKIDVLIIDSNMTVGSKYQTVLTDLNNLHHPFMKKYLSQNLIKNNQEPLDYFNQMLDKQNIKIDLQYTQKLSEGNIYLNFLKNFSFLFLKTLFTGSGFKKFYYKKNLKSHLDDSSRVNKLEYEFYILNKNIKILNNKKYYKKICKKAELNDKFVFFAAPFQPETNTGSILLQNFRDTYAVLLMLSEVIPNDWKIFYKEHPTSFKTFRGNNSFLIKNIDFYKKLKSIKNLKFIDHEFDLIQLIKKSQCVATQAGTTGFESIVNGKPTLLFGNCWYQGCKSVFNIKTLENLRDAIQKICKGFTPDKQDVLDYLHAVCESSQKDLTTYKFALTDLKNKNILSSNLPSQNKKLSEFLFKKYHEYYNN